MYHPKHRAHAAKITKRKITHRAAITAVATLGLSLAVPVGVATATTAGLTCTTAYTSLAEQQVCQQFSATIDAIMRKVVPAEQAALVDSLAAGLTLNGQSLSCVVDETCDYVPTALYAFQALHGTNLAGLTNDPDVTEAISTVLTVQSATVADEATQLVKLALSRVAGVDTLSRVGSLQQEMNMSLAQLSGCDIKTIFYRRVDPYAEGNCVTLTADVEAISRSAVGLVATALLAVPSQPSSGQYVSRGVATMESDEAVVTLPGADAIAPPVRCSAKFEYMASIYVDKVAFGWMDVTSQFGVLKMEYTDPAVMEPNCSRPAVDFEATTSTQAVSNAGSFLASKTKTSPLSFGRGRLEYGDPGYVYGAYQQWHTDSLEWEYNFPFGFVIHMFAPPAGNFVMDGHGTATGVGTWNFGGRKKRDSIAHCEKYGNADDVCTITHGEPFVL